MLIKKDTTKGYEYNNLLKTKHNISFVVNGLHSKEVIDDEIAQYENYLETIPEHKDQWNHKIQYLHELKNNKDYIEGIFPESIEMTILNTGYAYSFFQAIHQDDELLILPNKSYAASLFITSITHKMMSDVSKLFSGDSRDYSVTNIWHDFLTDIRKENITSNDEIDFITKNISRKSRDISFIIKTIKFRNKLVAHNDYIKNDERAVWRDFFETLKFLFRTWGILDAFFNPKTFPRGLQKSNTFNLGLSEIMSKSNFQRMNCERESIMGELVKASQYNLVSKKVDNICPFRDYTIKVSIR